ncbi:Vir protein [Parabacteroides sp.]|uniref:Vir protein n=1 Tax=Parabacteroides sp. TaxID=1869337 RepID=UPI002579C40B|nr:Vir protein [Parabacteroides sp.]
MKHINTFIIALCFLSICSLLQAQAPQLISYQAVARDLTGKVLSEKPISVQVEILQGSNQGTAVYTETHELTTTKTGTINLLIGGGNPQVGAFAEIDWSKAPYFLRLGMKQEKETEYKEVSNTQMVSVPYALYAEKAGSVTNVDSEDKPSDGTIKYGRDFILVPTDYDLFPSELYAAVGNIGLNESSTSTLFEFNIAYLTGTDLKLNAKIDGFEMSSKREESQSTLLGRYCCFRIPQQEKDKLETTLTIVNDKDEVVFSIPITINYITKE